MKVIVLYIALVGLPIFGVAGVLQLGQDLRPPLSVSGTWELQINSQFPHSSECQSRPADLNHLLLNISQSGRRLVVTFNNLDRVIPPELAGEISGQTIIGEEIERSAAFASTIQAKVERRDGADRLVGVLTLACCRPQADAPFVALRRHRTTKGSGVH